MKGIFRSPEIANLIAVVALFVSIISAFYAFRSHKFNTDVVMAKGKNVLIGQIESYLAEVDNLYNEYVRFLKESDLVLTNNSIILLGQNRESLRKTQVGLRKLLSELETAKLPVDPYFLGDAQRTFSRLNQKSYKALKDFEAIKAAALRDTSK